MLQSLENIDDDADRQDIHLVKTTDRDFAAEYGIEEMPGLVFFYRLIGSCSRNVSHPI